MLKFAASVDGTGDRPEAFDGDGDIRVKKGSDAIDIGHGGDIAFRTGRDRFGQLGEIFADDLFGRGKKPVVKAETDSGNGEESDDGADVFQRTLPII